MKAWIWRSAAALALVLLTAAAPGGGASAQLGSQNDKEREDVRLPNGKSQKDAILKNEHAQNLKDAAQLVELSQQLKEDLEKNDRFVLSIATLKKTDEIEKLVKKIRTRLRHD